MSINFDDREFDLNGLNLDDLDVRELEFRLELGPTSTCCGGGGGGTYNPNGVTPPVTYPQTQYVMPLFMPTSASGW